MNRLTLHHAVQLPYLTGRLKKDKNIIDEKINKEDEKKKINE